MTASSVTGIGQGMSNGKQKIQNHGSCPCSATQKQQPIEDSIKKNNCYLNYKSC